MGGIANVIEKVKQVGQGIVKLVNKIKNAIKFFMSTLRNDCGNNYISSNLCFGTVSFTKDGRAFFR